MIYPDKLQFEANYEKHLFMIKISAFFFKAKSFFHELSCSNK